MRLFLAVLVFADLALLGGIGAAIRYDRFALLAIRDSLFTRFTEDPGLLQQPPESMLRAGFQVDPPDEVDAWRATLDEEVAYLHDLDVDALPDDAAARAQAVVMLFSKNGGPGTCGGYRDLLHNVQRLPQGEGEGCCSDHTEVLLALGSVYGLTLRETHQSGHTHAEVYDPARGAWLWIDPLLALMARDEAGRYLSFLELRERYLAGRPIDFEFFGNDHHKMARMGVREHNLYDDPEDLWELSVTWGSNVFEQDRFSRRLGFLPKEAVQLVGFLVGERPPYLMLVDDYAHEAHELQRLRRRLLLGGGALLAAHVAFAVLWLRRRRA